MTNSGENPFIALAAHGIPSLPPDIPGGFEREHGVTDSIKPAVNEHLPAALGRVPGQGWSGCA